jgi:DNA-binding Lrp family transcriptional regulator
MKSEAKSNAISSLLNDFQKDFPIVSRPFEAIAKKVGLSEEATLKELRQLKAARSISRIGPVFKPITIGASTLAALSAPKEKLQETADLVSAYAEVNHNYEREHVFNLWFVVTAPTKERVKKVLQEINEKTGLEVLDLPLEEEFRIDLGFDLNK